MNDTRPVNIHHCFSEFFISQYVGLEHDQVDCWDLVRDFYKDVFEIELSSYDKTPNMGKLELQTLISAKTGDFTKIESRKEWDLGDILVMKIFGFENHIGLYIPDDKILHSTRKSGVVFESISRWSSLISGAYRHSGVPRNG